MICEALERKRHRGDSYNKITWEAYREERAVGFCIVIYIKDLLVWFSFGFWGIFFSAGRKFIVSCGIDIWGRRFFISEDIYIELFHAEGDWGCWILALETQAG